MAGSCCTCCARCWAEERDLEFGARRQTVVRSRVLEPTAVGTLSVDGKQVAQGKIERTIPTRFSLDETLDVGEDTGTPVVEDYVNKMPFKFTGDLKKVVIELGKSGLTASDKKKLEEANKKLTLVHD